MLSIQFNQFKSNIKFISPLSKKGHFHNPRHRKRPVIPQQSSKSPTRAGPSVPINRHKLNWPKLSSGRTALSRKSGKAPRTIIICLWTEWTIQTPRPQINHTLFFEKKHWLLVRLSKYLLFAQKRFISNWCCSAVHCITRIRQVVHPCMCTGGVQQQTGCTWHRSTLCHRSSGPILTR